MREHFVVNARILFFSLFSAMEFGLSLREPVVTRSRMRAMLNLAAPSEKHRSWTNLLTGVVDIDCDADSVVEVPRLAQSIYTDLLQREVSPGQNPASARNS